MFYTSLSPVQKPEYQFSFILTDSKYQIIDKVLPYQFTLAPWGSDNKVFKLNNSEGHYFYANYSNKIFHLNGDSIQPRYTILNFNGFELPPDNFYLEREKIGKSSTEVYDEVWNSNYILSYYYFEIDNNLLLFLTSSGKDFVSYLNTENGNQWHAGELVDDYGLFLDGKFSRPKFIYGNKIGYYLYPFFALKDMKNNPQREINPIIGKLKEDQNPILVLFTFK